LVRSGDKTSEAVEYAQKQVTPLIAQFERQSDIDQALTKIQEAMATLAYPADQFQNIAHHYAHLFSNDQWDYLGNQFRSVTKPCVVIKGTTWLKNTVSILGNLFNHTGTQTNPSECPKYII